jgi:hypothetical protein
LILRAHLFSSSRSTVRPCRGSVSCCSSSTEPHPIPRFRFLQRLCSLPTRLVFSLGLSLACCSFVYLFFSSIWLPALCLGPLLPRGPHRYTLSTLSLFHSSSDGSNVTVT